MIDFTNLDFSLQRPDATREEKLRVLELYYLRHMVEDPRDGTQFDCDILDAIQKLKDKYKSA